MKTSIIIPTYNEKENIRRLIPMVFKIVPHASIIIVDDHSPDGTAEAARKLTKKYSGVHVIERKGKGGRGSAVIAGLKFAYDKLKSEIFLEMDADLSHDPSELPSLLSLSKPMTVVLASRYIKGSRILGVPLNRRVMSWFSNFFIRLVLRLPISDNTNGYRCYRKDAVEILIKHLFISHGYILLSESLYLLYTHGFSFIEFPSIFINRKFGVSNATLSEFFHASTKVMRIRAYIDSL